MPVVYTTPPTKNKRITDLLLRALDPGAPEPEAIASAAAMIRHARREQMGLDTFAQAIGVERQLPRPAAKAVPVACYIIMPHGKWKGFNLRQIGERDLAYLQWLSAKHSNPDLAEAAGEVLKYLVNGRAA